MLLTDFGKNNSVGVFLIAIFVSILPVIACMGIVDRSWKRIKDRKKRVIRFESEGIRLANDQVEIFYKWSACGKVTETEKYLFAETNSRRPLFVLCKYRLDESILDEVKNYLIHKGFPSQTKGNINRSATECNEVDGS